MSQKIAVLLTLFFIAQPLQAHTATLVQQHYAEWASILEHYVDEQGRTDFNALALDDGRLKPLVEFVSQISPASHPQLFSSNAQVLAYHINTYNILAMNGVIEAGIPKNFGNFFKRARFFKFRSVIIGGKKTSLYDYENKVIRPLNEPRVHFALNCMVKDCPRLPRFPFDADQLEQQLDQVTSEFFTKAKHIRIDSDKKTVYLSAILDFYTEDFTRSGKPQDLASYVNQYRQAPLPSGYKIEFIPYDWTVNQQP